MWVVYYVDPFGFVVIDSLWDKYEDAKKRVGQIMFEKSVPMINVFFIDKNVPDALNAGIDIPLQ